MLILPTSEHQRRPLGDRGDLRRIAVRRKSEKSFALCASAMTSSSPHVTLAGFGYLEPLARPIRCPASINSASAQQQPGLSKKLLKLTDRLATKSNWVRRESHSPQRSRYPEGEFSSPRTDSFSNYTSSYAQSGSWPRSSSPRPSEARSPNSTALQRRNPPTTEFHVPASPEFRRIEPEPEPPLHTNAWRR